MGPRLATSKVLDFRLSRYLGFATQAEVPRLATSRILDSMLSSLGIKAVVPRLTTIKMLDFRLSRHSGLGT